MKTKEKKKNKKIHLLFICTANVNRSPTAEDLFYKNEDIEADSAGTHILAIKRIRQYLVDWADEIFVMSEKQKKFVENHFKLGGKEIQNLEIPDIYARSNPELVKILKEKLKRLIDTDVKTNFH